MFGGSIDIGAYERQYEELPNLVVDSLLDENDGDFSAGHFSLREAIGLANGSFNPDTISFAASLTANGPATIDLVLGELLISNDLGINGPGSSLLTIRAIDADATANGNGARIFNIDDGDIANTAAVTIAGLTLSGGDSEGSGGAIRSIENLTILQSTVSGNTAAGHGGAIFTIVGNLNVVDSIVSGNTARDYATYGGGGGIAALGYLRVIRSAIFGNSAHANGGGVFARNWDLTIINSTISGNI